MVEDQRQKKVVSENSRDGNSWRLSDFAGGCLISQAVKHELPEGFIKKSLIDLTQLCVSLCNQLFLLQKLPSIYAALRSSGCVSKEKREKRKMGLEVGKFDSISCNFQKIRQAVICF